MAIGATSPKIGAALRPLAVNASSSRCWRRKLFEAFELNSSQIAGQAVALIAKLYEIEREVKDSSDEARLLARQTRSKPVADALHAWLTTQPPGMPGSFENGAGIFEVEEDDKGTLVAYRGVWDLIGAQSCRWPQGASSDGGRSWSLSWSMDWVRVG